MIEPIKPVPSMGYKEARERMEQHRKKMAKAKEKKLEKTIVDEWKAKDNLWIV